MQNRIRQYDISNRYSRYFSLSELGLFEGANIEALIADFIKVREDIARREGKIEAFEEIKQNVRKQIDDYIMLITKVINFVCKTSKLEFENKELKITESRTNLFFDTRKINILFIIDASFEIELDFSNLLNEVQRVVLKEENFVAELLYINNRNAELDISSINSDFPLVRKVENSSQNAK